ncbi:hypothetical protein RQP46_007798 [Phenoliferia psychrophenolica]
MAQLPVPAEQYLLLLLSDRHVALLSMFATHSLILHPSFNSNLPTGGFIASSGLESHIQHGLLLSSDSTKAEGLLSFLRASVSSHARLQLPFLSAVHTLVSSLALATSTSHLEEVFARIKKLDAELEAMTLNHVQRRASAAQGVALLTLFQRSFAEEGGEIGEGKLETVGFAVLAAGLGVSLPSSIHLFLFLHARSLLSSAVRLNSIGPYVSHRMLLHDVRGIVDSAVLEYEREKEAVGDDWDDDADDERGPDEALLRFLTAQAAAFDPPPLPLPASPLEQQALPLHLPAFAQGGVGWGLGGEAYFGGDVWSGPSDVLVGSSTGVEEYDPFSPALDPPHRAEFDTAAYAQHPLAHLPAQQVFFTAPPPLAPATPYTFLLPAPPPGAPTLGPASSLPLPSHDVDPFAGLYRAPLSPLPLPLPITSTSTSSATSTSPPPIFTTPEPLRAPSPSFIPYVSLGSTNRIIASSLPTPLAAKPGRKAAIPGGRKKGAAAADKADKGDKGKDKGGALELNGKCWTCGEAIAKLVLRKPVGGVGGWKGDLEDLAPRATLTCPACVVSLEERDEVVSPAGGAEDEPHKWEPTYLDTFSAAIDRLERIKLDADEGDEAERRAMESLVASPEALGAEPLHCDVCDRIVGAGKVSNMVAADSGRVNFTIEVLCKHCLERYKPCSDCGSGGGRLTPGKWRCKELFPENRRTCRLLHTRNPPLQDITFTIQNITELRIEEIPILEARCRQLYFQARLNEFARPESLEGKQELGRNFREIEQMTTDSWNLLAPQFREVVEESRGIRRYLALQLARPHGRRSKDKANEAEAPLMVTGFFMTELEGFKANTILGDKMLDRCRSDLHLLNCATSPSPAYPEMQHIWTIASFRSSSRLAISLMKRGFVYLPDAIARRPEMDQTAFPPGGRDMWIPRHVMHAWEILVKYVGDGSHLFEE